MDFRFTYYAREYSSDRKSKILLILLNFLNQMLGINRLKNSNNFSRNFFKLDKIWNWIQFVIFIKKIFMKYILKSVEIRI